MRARVRAHARVRARVPSVCPSLKVLLSVQRGCVRGEPLAQVRELARRRADDFECSDAACARGVTVGSLPIVPASSDANSSLTGTHRKGQNGPPPGLFAQLVPRYPREGRSIVQVVDGRLPGIKIIRPQIFGDDRGFFFESYSASAYAAAGIDTVFVQDNHSRSVKGTLRGVHYQSRPGQAKLVRVVLGRIWDVMVDIRRNSPTFGRWEAVELDDTAREQLFIPIGFAHGFCVLSDFAEVEYKVSAPYDPKTECSISYADPELAIQWPVAQPLLSVRDQQAESFAAFRSRAEAD